MAIKSYHVVRRSWRARKPVWFLMVVELLLIVVLLVLFGLAQPDVFRTLMWRIGYAEKLNSNPNMVLYAYANHLPQPMLPLVWSQQLTDFNVVVAVISLFFLLAKMIAFIMKVYFPVISVLCNLGMVGLYAASAGGQAGPDYLDPLYPSPVPWYLSKGCSIAARYNARKTCTIVQGTFAATVLMLVTYLANLAWSIYSMIPTKNEGKGADNDDDEINERNSASSHSPTDGKNWEMQPVAPRAGQVPFTPRTQAFHTLDRKLPFRAYSEQRP